MSEDSLSSHIHLPDLSIEGFRGIDSLSIERLGRVTLLAGRNGVGKTTVLEACRVYAERGRPRVLSELVRAHEEYFPAPDEEGEKISTPNLASLFHGRDPSLNARIVIGPREGSAGDRLRIELSRPSEQFLPLLEGMAPDNLADSDLRVLKIVFQEREHVIPWILTHFERGGLWRRSQSYRGRQGLSSREELPPALEYVSLGPGLIQNAEVAAFWDRVALTDDESHAVKALQLVLGNTVEGIAMVGDAVTPSRRSGRRAVVKFRDHHGTVPLKSLGDGAIRFFGIALALANSRNGFLFIDEAENGIHYSVQPEFWHMVLRMAHAENVQVLATTHSWDCIRGFAQAASAIDDTEGTLIRLEKENGRLHAIEYSESELETASEQGIEVR